MDETTDPDSSGGSGRGALIGLGATALAAGAAGLIAGGVLAARDGDCIEGSCPGPDGIVRRRDYGATPTLLLVGGAVLAATGAVLTILGIRITPSMSADGAGLSLQTNF